MRIMIACIHYPVASGRYVADAFRRLGHEVRSIGNSTGNTIWGMEVDTKHIWSPDSAIVSADAKWPDLVIVMDSDQWIWNEVAAVRFHCPVVVYGVDNHVRSYDISLFQHKFLAHYHSKVHPVSLPNETWLPCAGDSAIFTPSKIEWSKREYDVALVGVQYPRRVAIAERLRAEGLKVFTATGLLYEEYAAAYQNSRIALCVSINGDLAQRVFEGAMMGCTVLTDLLLDLTDEETNRKLGLSGFFVYQNDAEAVGIAKDLVTVESAMAQFGALTLQKIVRERHTWEARCQVVVDWFEKEYGSVQMVEEVNQHVDIEKIAEELKIATKGFMPEFHLVDHSKAEDGWTEILLNAKPYLNLGCGKTHFPSAKPPGHESVPDSVYSYPLFLNIDKVDGVGADLTFDLFSYPWPLPDASFDGAIVAHVMEHIPHEIKLRDNSERAMFLSTLQDGWYSFLSELFRVLTPNAIVHIVSPYGFSDGGITDPSHHRYLTMNTFTHSMTPEIGDGSTFKYNNGGINFQIEGVPQYRMTPYGELLHQRTGFDYDLLMGIYNNICYDMYVALKAVK